MAAKFIHTVFNTGCFSIFRDTGQNRVLENLAQTSNILCGHILCFLIHKVSFCLSHLHKSLRSLHILLRCHHLNKTLLIREMDQNCIFTLLYFGICESPTCQLGNKLLKKRYRQVYPMEE